MEKDLEEIILEHLKYLSEYLEPLNKIVLSLSPIFLLFGFSGFSIYSIFIAKDPSFILNFSSSFEIISFYYATLTLFLIIFIVFLLAYPLLLQEVFNPLFQVIKGRLPQILKNVLNFLKGHHFLFIIIIIAFFIYILLKILKRPFFIIPFFILLVIYIVQGGFFILPITGHNMPPLTFWIINIIIFIIIYIIFLYPLIMMTFNPTVEDKNRIEDKDIIKAKNRIRIKAILFLFIIIAVTYTKSLIITPLKLSKLGYFEAILTLDKPEFQACLKMCQTEGEREKEQQNTSTYNSNQPQDIQNNNYHKRFFVFLRTSSEYIVGCSKHSNVRIYIPSDKVIAIKYVENQKTRGQKIQPNNDKK
ncbi:MAG: hypothetical protein RXN80_00580 [Hydrogenobaculum sp.]